MGTAEFGREGVVLPAGIAFTMKGEDARCSLSSITAMTTHTPVSGSARLSSSSAESRGV